MADDDKPVRVFKIECRLQEGTMSKDDGFIPLIPGADLYTGFMITQEGAKVSGMRDSLSARAMDAFWEKLGLLEK